MTVLKAFCIIIKCHLTIQIYNVYYTYFTFLRVKIVFWFMVISPYKMDRLVHLKFIHPL